MHQQHQEQSSFRDSVSTIDNKGKRVWIYPKKPFGKWYRLRSISTVFFMLVFFGLPLIKVNGDPLFLVNILERRFILFGQVFWPHDFIIFGVGMVLFLVFIVLFTVVFGRIFCGWICPQTVFMEMVFRKIEYWIEGDYMRQKALDKAPWNKDKVIKKGSKWVIFYIISFMVGNTFLAYIIGIDALKEIVTSPVSQHLNGFLFMLLFSAVFFFVFTWFREQVCLVVCPYGRLQGVLLDKDSVVVAYDDERGEPRGKIQKNPEETRGDCIDCRQCVHVCPTGIDIRNGTQLECVNCTACIDACDDIMEKINRPKGLVRYASENEIRSKKKTGFTLRMKAYVGVLLVLVGIEVSLLASRTDVDANILRAGGSLYYADSVGIKNLYNLKVVNKTRNDIHAQLVIENQENASLKVIGEKLMLKANTINEATFMVDIPHEFVKEHTQKLKISIYSLDNGKRLQTIKTPFLGPIIFD